MALSETFWVSFITIGAGLITACLGLCYKSKCSECDCFGVHLKRDIKSEVKEDLAQIKKSSVDEPPTPVSLS